MQGGVRHASHQFPPGMTMSLERRMALLKWASRTGAFIIEDDYDSDTGLRGARYPHCKASAAIPTWSWWERYEVAVPIAADWLRGLAIFPCGLVPGISLSNRFSQPEPGSGGALRFHRRGIPGMPSPADAQFIFEPTGALIDCGRRHLRGLVRISDVRAGLYVSAAHSADAAVSATRTRNE